MIKELRNLNGAMQKLSSTWSLQNSKTLNVIDEVKYPFEKDFDEVVSDVAEWCETVETVLIRQLPTKYCMYVNESGEGNFEPHWFYQARFYENDVMLEEGIGIGVTRNDDVVSLDEYKKSFVEVPEEMFNLYMKLCQDGDDTSDLVNLALKLYDTRKEEK